MSAVTLPSEPTPSAVQGAAEISFVRKEGRTRLGELYQHDPLRALFPLPPAGEAMTAALVTTSGGLVGGDEMSVRISVEEGAQALVTAQAAEKVYRSAGADCRIEMELNAGPGSWLEWLPQETIVFEGARFRRRTRIDAAPRARVLAGEILAFGRAAMGEKLTGGLIRDAWELRRDGRLVWADALHMGNDLAGPLGHPAGFGGAGACATAVYFAEDAAERLDLARKLLGEAVEGLRAAATVVNGVLVARWIAGETRVLRRAFEIFWAGFRHGVAGLPAALPRLWHI